MFEIILLWIFKSNFRKTDIGKLKALRRDEQTEECERLLTKTQSNKSNWWNITRCFHWMSIMHNHSLPKEHLATWNRIETTRKAVRELTISCFGLAFQPRSSIWHMFVKSVSNLDLMQRIAIDYSRAISDQFNEIFRRVCKDLEILYKLTLWRGVNTILHRLNGSKN